MGRRLRTSRSRAARQPQLNAVAGRWAGLSPDIPLSSAQIGWPTAAGSSELAVAPEWRAKTAELAISSVTGDLLRYDQKSTLSASRGIAAASGIRLESGRTLPGAVWGCPIILSRLTRRDPSSEPCPSLKAAAGEAHVTIDLVGNGWRMCANVYISGGASGAHRWTNY